MDRTITHDQGQTMLFHRRSLALVGLLIALLTTLAIQPATAAAQSISYSSGPRNLISDGGFESEQSAWTSVESPYRTSQRAHCGRWSMNFGWLGNGSLFQEVTVRQRRGALILSTGCAVRALTADSCTSACIHPLKTAPFAPPLRTLATHNAGNTPANSWTGYAADLSDFRGQTIRLQFDLAGFQPAFPIYFCLDDVELWTDFVLSVPGSSS